MKCNECKHYALDEEKAPCKYCEGLDKFEVPATHDELTTLKADLAAALERVAILERHKSELTAERDQCLELATKNRVERDQLKRERDEVKEELYRWKLAHSCVAPTFREMLIKAEDKGRCQGFEDCREAAKKVCAPYTHGQWFMDKISALTVPERGERENRIT